MRVAFASGDGIAVDRHFGQADQFFIWEISPEDARCVGQVTATPEPGDYDPTLGRADVLTGCKLVYSMQIGGPAAAKLVSRHIHPLKTTVEVPIADAVAKLQGVLRGTPPPWLRKAMGLPGREYVATEED